MQSVAISICVAVHCITAQPVIDAHNNLPTGPASSNTQDVHASVPAMTSYLSHLFHHHAVPGYHQQLAAAALQQQAQHQQRLQQVTAQILNYVNAQNNAQNAEVNNYHENVMQLLVRIVRSVDADHNQIGVLSRLLTKIIGDQKPSVPQPEPDSLVNFLQQQSEKSSQPENYQYLMDWLSQHRDRQPQDCDKVEASLAQIFKLHMQQHSSLFFKNRTILHVFV